MDRMCLGNLAWSKSIELLSHINRAPDDSALNPVERFFAPCSKATVNNIYPYDFYGNHLNSKKEVFDKELCYKNFEFSAKRLQADLSTIQLNGNNPMVRIRLEKAALQFFNGAFSSIDYALYLKGPKNIPTEMRKKNRNLGNMVTQALTISMVQLSS